MTSILTQTLTNIEIICIDDCSTDNSLQILCEFADKDGRISVYRHNENNGVSVARNNGLNAARGEFIYFCDSDDYLATADALATMYAEAKGNDLDILAFSVRQIYDDEEALAHENGGDEWYYRKKHNYENLGVVEGYKLYYELLNNHDYVPLTVAHLWRRNFLLESNLRFLPIYAEDELFYFQSFMYAKRTKCIDKCLYVYRRRQNSLTIEKSDGSKLFAAWIVITCERLKTLAARYNDMEDPVRTFIGNSEVYGSYRNLRINYADVKNPAVVGFADPLYHSALIRFREAETMRRLMRFWGKQQPLFMGDEGFRDAVCKFFDIVQADFIVLDTVEDGKRWLNPETVLKNCRPYCIHVIFSQGYEIIAEWLTTQRRLVENRHFFDGRPLVPEIVRVIEG